MLTMQLAIATLGQAGIDRAASMLLKPQPWLSYAISWQIPDRTPLQLPDILTRKDVAVSKFYSIGGSANRNNAFAISSADIVLPADDDLDYSLEALKQLRLFFEQHPDADYVLFCQDCSNISKKYPDKTIEIPPFRQAPFDVTTFEIAVRQKVVAGGHTRFDTRFGLNTPRYRCAEDELFALTLSKKGFKGYFVPLTVCRHNGVSTGYRPVSHHGIPRAAGVLISWKYPFTAILRWPLTAWRWARRGRYPFIKGLWWIGVGWFESFFLKKPWKK